MKKLITLMTLILVSCTYDYKVPVDTDTIKYVIEHPIVASEADTVKTSGKIVEIKGEPEIYTPKSINCPALAGFMASNILLTTYCNMAQKENYTCCRVPYDDDNLACKIYFCHTNVTKDYTVACMGYSEECE